MADDDQQRFGARRITAGQVGAGVLAVAALVFILQNTDSTRVGLLFTSVDLPLFVVILVSMALGAMIALLARRKR